MNIDQKNKIIIISSPSGAGKTTLCKLLLKKMNNINIELLNYEGDREINLNLVSKLRANSTPKGKLYKIKIMWI